MMNALTFKTVAAFEKAVAKIRATLTHACDVPWCDQEAALVWQRTPEEIKASEVKAQRRVVRMIPQVCHCQTHVPPWRAGCYVPLGQTRAMQPKAAKSKPIRALRGTPVVDTRPEAGGWAMIAASQIVAALGVRDTGKLLMVQEIIERQCREEAA